MLHLFSIARVLDPQQLTAILQLLSLNGFRSAIKAKTKNYWMGCNWADKGKWQGWLFFKPCIQPRRYHTPTVKACAWFVSSLVRTCLQHQKHSYFTIKNGFKHKAWRTHRSSEMGMRVDGMYGWTGKLTGIHHALVSLPAFLTPKKDSSVRKHEPQTQRLIFLPLLGWLL